MKHKSLQNKRIMNKLNRFTVVLALFLIFSSKLIAQSLSLNDLQMICNKSNWEQVNQYLMNKGWEYYESEKGSSTRYNTITWSFNKSYGDRAEAWFYIYTYEGFPNKIAYSVFNKPAYSKIQNSLNSLGYKLTDSEIDDNEITSIYSNNMFVLKITTEKREKKDDFSYYDESITAYRFLLIKKSGVYDPDNGKKVEYWYGDVIQAEYTLKEGNLEGSLKTYYENGELKKQGFYKNGKANGKFIEFDENGNKTAEYNMLEDQPNGLATIFEKNKKSIEKVYEKGELNGQYTEYYYDDDNNLNMKVQGFYKSDEKNGTWYTFVVNDNEIDTVEIRNFKNDLRHGNFKEYLNSDTIEISNYYNDVREGSYIMKTKTTGYITDEYLPISWWNTACEGYYTNGQRDGNWKFYSMGILSEEGKYKNDQKSGKWTKYVTMGNHSGEILSETDYRNDIENGTYKRFFELDLITDSTSENISYKFNNTPIYE